MVSNNYCNGDATKKFEFDDALDKTGFGIYTFGMLCSCCLLILAMYVDIFGGSVVLPAAACDLQMTSSQQALLSALPLIGVMLSSYIWGLLADIVGRRSTLLSAMTVGVILNFAASMAPTYEVLAVIKFLSAAFTASANAAGFVLVGETTPRKHRNRFLFLMATTTMIVQLVICLFALPVFSLSFRISVPWLALEYRPWRLLMQLITIPGLLGVVLLFFLQESPKFLLSKGNMDDCLKVLGTMYAANTRSDKVNYEVTSVYLNESGSSPQSSTNISIFRRMWDQTAPLFRPPLLKHNLMLYFMLMCAYMTSTGYTMWVPTVTNAYFSGDSVSGLTFCQVASNATIGSADSNADCDSVIENGALYASMAYSGLSGLLNLILSFVVGGLFDRRRACLLIFSVSSGAGLTLLFVNVPAVSILLFFLFLYVALILGNANSYLVELNPTHLRGMATCISVVVARGFGFSSVQLIAALLPDHCSIMVSSYLALVMCGGAVAYFLPSDEYLRNRKQVPPNLQVLPNLQVPPSLQVPPNPQTPPNLQVPPNLHETITEDNSQIISKRF